MDINEIERWRIEARNAFGRASEALQKLEHEMRNIDIALVYLREELKTPEDRKQEEERLFSTLRGDPERCDECLAIHRPGENTLCKR